MSVRQQAPDRARRAIVTVSGTTALALSALVGCGDQDRAGGEALPLCSDVWVEGRTLPRDYAGCRESDEPADALVSTVIVLCDGPDGDRGYHTHSRYWAITGETIQASASGNPSSDDPEADCTG